MRDARLILLCYSLSLVATPAMAQQTSLPGERPPSRLLAQQAHTGGDRMGFLKAVLHISPPQSGVKLLEELFQRVRSVPQVAMAKNLMQQQEAQNNMVKLAQAPSDQNLMIRPQAIGKQASMPQPTMTLGARANKLVSGGLPPVNMGSSIRQPGDNMYLPSNASTVGGLHGSTPGYRGGYAAGGGGTNAGSLADSAGQLPPPPPTVDVYMGNKPTPMSADGQGNGRGLWTNSVAWDSKDTARQKSASTWYNTPREIQIVDERPLVRDFRDAPGSGPSTNSNKGDRSDRSMRSATSAVYSPQASAAAPVANPAQAPDLGTATGRLYKLSAALQKLQEGRPADLDSMLKANEKEEKSQTRATSTTGYSSQERAASPSPMRSGAMVAGKIGNSYAPQSQMLVAEPSSNAASESERRYRKSAATKKSAYKESAKLRNEKSTLNDDLESDALPMGRAVDKIAMSNSSIAALPPNVVTGIPLVRLGISETQAASALRSIGTTQQDTVDKWRVISWKRNNNKTQTALQLYVRNGQLDAMRIFDPSLISTDFGVSMGDDLSRVKERFGEPAFILAEPGPGAGQNYIYPISQVGFQLSRSAPDQQPRVISVLIFNVK